MFKRLWNFAFNYDVGEKSQEPLNEALKISSEYYEKPIRRSPDWSPSDEVLSRWLDGDVERHKDDEEALLRVEKRFIYLGAKAYATVTGNLDEYLLLREKSGWKE